MPRSTADTSGQPDRHAGRPRDGMRVRPRLIVAGDVTANVVPLALLIAVAAVSLVVGRHTASDDGGIRDTSVIWGFYGALMLVWLAPLYLAGYAAARIITIAAGTRLPASIGYASLVTSLVLAIFVNTWGALILGALPATGALASVVAYTVSDPMGRHTALDHSPSH